MKKLIAFFSAITFLGSSTLAVSACGVSKGHPINVEIKNAPTKAEKEQTPSPDNYLYNDTYVYNEVNAAYLPTLAAQLVSDKIYYDNGKTLNDDDWKAFYHSTEWRKGYFSSFNYDDSENNRGFSYQDSAGNDFIYQITNNDASVEANKVRIYWYLTSTAAWTPDTANSYQPTKNNITMPALADFAKDTDIIKKQGWVHFWLGIGQYRIDFSVQITFSFGKITDKNKDSFVVLNLATFSKPLGDIKFDDSEAAANEIIGDNLYLSKSTTTE